MCPVLTLANNAIKDATFKRIFNENHFIKTAINIALSRDNQRILEQYKCDS